MSRRKSNMNGDVATIEAQDYTEEVQPELVHTDTDASAELTWAQKQYLIQGIVRYLVADGSTDLSNAQDYGTSQFTVQQLFDACERMEVPCTKKEVTRVVNGLVNGGLLGHLPKSRLYSWNHERQHKDRAFFQSLRANLPNR